MTTSAVRRGGDEGLKFKAERESNRGRFTGLLTPNPHLHPWRESHLERNMSSASDEARLQNARETVDGE